MGGVGRAIAAVATGGASEAARAVLPDNVYKPVASALSLGASDVVEGGNAPFTGAIRYAGPSLGMDESHMNWLEDFSSDVHSMGLTQLPKAYSAATEDGGFDVWKGIDRAVDPAGTIDYSLRRTGDNLYDVAPNVVQYAQPAGSVIGGIVGSYIPVIGTAAGAAIGSGVGSKIGAGTRFEDYGRDFINAGISYGAGAATQGIGQYVGNAASEAGIQGGKIIGGAAQGAAKGALTAAPSAYEQGSLKPIVVGAGIGGVAGGIGAGVKDLYSPDLKDVAYEYAQEHPGEQVYLESPQQAMTNEAYQYAEQNPGQWVDTKTGQINPYYGAGTPETLYQTSDVNINSAPANPSGMFPLDAFSNIQYAPAAPETTYPLASDVEKLNAYKAEPQFASNYIHPYTLSSGYGADVKIGSTNYDPFNTYLEQDPTLWDRTRSLMSKVGDSVLRSNLGKLGQQMIADSAGSAGVEGEEGRSGSSTNEDSVDTVMTRLRGAESAKKAKQSGFVELLDPTTGLPIMLGDVAGYKEEQQPEQKLYS